MKNEIQNMTREQFGKRWLHKKAEFLADVGATLALLGGPKFDPEKEWEEIIDLEYSQYIEDQEKMHPVENTEIVQVFDIGEFFKEVLGFEIFADSVGSPIEDEPDSWIDKL